MFLLFLNLHDLGIIYKRGCGVNISADSDADYYYTKPFFQVGASYPD